MKKSLTSARIAIIITIAVVLALATACAQQAAPATITKTVEKTITQTVAATTTPATTTAPSTQNYVFTFAWDNVYSPQAGYSHQIRPGGELQRLLYERSGGRIQLNIVDKMLPSLDILAAIGKGEADMGDPPVVFAHSTYPIFGWGEIPAILGAERYNARLAMQLALQDPRLLAIMDEQFRKIGVTYLGAANTGCSMGVYAQKKITKLEDLKGLKVRIFGSLTTEALRRLGATAVTMSIGEVGPAMKTGVVDAVYTNPADGYMLWGFPDYVKYYDTIPGLTNMWLWWWVMNAEKFDALPPDLQEVMRDVFHNTIGWQAYFAIVQNFLSYDKLNQDKGVEFVQFEPEELEKVQKLLEPMKDEWLKIAGPRGPEVLAILKEVWAKYQAFETHPK